MSLLMQAVHFVEFLRSIIVCDEFDVECTQVDAICCIRNTVYSIANITEMYVSRRK